MRYFALFISSISSLILILNLNGKVLAGSESTKNPPIPDVHISLALCLASVPLSFSKGDVVCYYLNGEIKTVLFDGNGARRRFEEQLVNKRIDFVGFTME